MPGGGDYWEVSFMVFPQITSCDADGWEEQKKLKKLKKIKNIKTKKKKFKTKKTKKKFKK